MPKGNRSKGKRDTKRRRPAAGAASRDKQDQSYRHAVPDRNALLDHLREVGQPQSLAALQRAFAVRNARARGQLEKRLGRMVHAGLLLKNRSDDYCLVEKLDLKFGTVSRSPGGLRFCPAGRWRRANLPVAP